MTDAEAIEEGLKAIGRILAEGILEELEARPPIVQSDTREECHAGRSEECMDAVQLAEHLAITRQAVWRLARQGTIPAIRLGHKTLRFNVEEVMAALEAPK